MTSYTIYISKYRAPVGRLIGLLRKELMSISACAAESQFQPTGESIFFPFWGRFRHEPWYSLYIPTYIPT